MKFLENFNKFHVNESKNIKFDIQSEFQSVIDLLDDEEYKATKYSIEIEIAGAGQIKSASLEDLNDIIEGRKKGTEVLEDCSHVVERLADYGHNIDMYIDDYKIIIKVEESNSKSSEYTNKLENCFEIDGNSIKVEFNILKKYLKSKYNINLISTDDESNPLDGFRIVIEGSLSQAKINEFSKNMKSIGIPLRKIEKYLSRRGDHLSLHLIVDSYLKAEK